MSKSSKKDAKDAKTPETDRKLLDLEQEFIVLVIPADTVEVDITAKIYTDGEVMKVGRHMDFPEVRDAIEEAKGGYIPKDALFSLVKTGRDKIDDLLSRYIDSVDDDL